MAFLAFVRYRIQPASIILKITAGIHLKKWTPPILWELGSCGFERGWKKTPNIKKRTCKARDSRPTAVLAWGFEAWIWQSGRDASFSSVYGGITAVKGVLYILYKYESTFHDRHKAGQISFIGENIYGLSEGFSNETTVTGVTNLNVVRNVN